MDYDHLAEQLQRRSRWPAIMVAIAGTTMTEAVDNTTHIRDVGTTSPHSGAFTVGGPAPARTGLTGDRGPAAETFRRERERVGERAEPVVSLPLLLSDARGALPAA
ncbi:hypothetical protein GCM10009541_54370 [Micromonospora gifhornensis]|uniref:Uncharacterized protein n=1 Tax=Micromonospora gifhornensis TaxID=84594 RepID=A0ABQ4IN49_9ACTN|nr:hypothetical protein Vgi01_60230 [Micromonospora gifhornensis]